MLIFSDVWIKRRRFPDRHGRNHLGQKKRWDGDGIFGTAVRMWPCLGRHCVTLTVAGQLLLRLRNLLALPGNRRNKHVSKCGCRDKETRQSRYPWTFYHGDDDDLRASHKWTVVKYRNPIPSIIYYVHSKKLRQKVTTLTEWQNQLNSCNMLFFPLSFCCCLVLTRCPCFSITFLLFLFPCETMSFLQFLPSTTYCSFIKKLSQYKGIKLLSIHVMTLQQFFFLKKTLLRYSTLAGYFWSLKKNM